MKKRFATSLIATLALAALVAPSAIAADLGDVGFMDQAEIANIPAFVDANRQLAAYKSQLDAQFDSAMKAARTDADRQRIQLDFQQRFQDKQREVVGPLFTRAQLAIASVSSTRNLSVVVDKRIVIYGGQDITKDVEQLFLSSQAINPPTATPPPSSIGYVDQTVLDSLPRVKSANDQMAQFEQQQKATFGPQVAAAQQAKDQAKAQSIYQQYQKAIDDKQTELLKPLVDATKTATADVARKKSLILVVDRADVLAGGTDITADVQNELNK